MWSSTGNFPPVGLFDGQFTDLGSYCGCLDINMRPKAINSTIASLAEPKYSSYCTVAFRPIVPSRPKFHMIFQRESQDLISTFNTTDVFSDIAQWAQYFHYVYLKTGVCVPNDCSPSDMQKVANAIANKLFLMAGPVKCFTHAPHNPNEMLTYSDNSDYIVADDNRPMLINTGQPLNRKQLISLVILMMIFLIPFVATLWHALELWPKWRDTVSLRKDSLVVVDYSDRRQEVDNSFVKDSGAARLDSETRCESCYGIKFVAFEYLSMITNARQFMDTSIRQNEIRCLHGLRVVTMVWIIAVHTLQYNEWSGFTRIFRNVNDLQNPFLHPLFNANYVVDNFFLMSGLLVSYTIWFSHKGSSKGFSLGLSLLGRYLRLTPQVLLVSLMYIVLPALNHGPFWYDMTHDAGVYCEKNWWINLLHLQSFYKSDQMCNLVSWWISVDMLYYVLALILVLLILKRQTRIASMLTFVIVGYCTLQTAYQHYTGGYTPNNLGTVPQVAEVWSSFVVKFVWSPFPHAFPFYLGLWIGYMLANKKWQRFVVDHHRIGWITATIALLAINMSSHIWMSGAVELSGSSAAGTSGMHQSISTTYNIACTILWALGFAWIIVSCHYGCAPNLDRLLSINIFVLLSKVSFIIYLSHMLIVRAIFGSQYTLLEVSVVTVTYLMIGNIVVSTLFGIFLNIAFESPCMKFQRALINKLKDRGGSKHYPIGSMPLATATTLMTVPSTTSRVNLDINSVGDRSDKKTYPTNLTQ